MRGTSNADLERISLLTFNAGIACGINTAYKFLPQVLAGAGYESYALGKVDDKRSGLPLSDASVPHNIQLLPPPTFPSLSAAAITSRAYERSKLLQLMPLACGRFS